MSSSDSSDEVVFKVDLGTVGRSSSQAVTYVFVSGDSGDSRCDGSLADVMCAGSFDLGLVQVLSWPS